MPQNISRINPTCQVPPKKPHHAGQIERVNVFKPPRIVCPLCGSFEPHNGIYCDTCLPTPKKPRTAIHVELADRQNQEDLYRAYGRDQYERTPGEWVDVPGAESAGLVGGRISSRAGFAGEDIAHRPAGRAYFEYDPGFHVSATPGGLRISTDAPPMGEMPERSGGKRGTVMGFSAASRRRMMQVLARFDFRRHGAKGKRSHSARAMFATLTYSDLAAPPQIQAEKLISFTAYNPPALAPREPVNHAGLQRIIDGRAMDAARYKRDLTTFIKRLERMHGFSGCLWKMEIEPRKSGTRIGELIPHFHLLLLFQSPRMLSGFRRWLSLSWFQAVGSDDPDHRKAGTNIQVAYGGADGRLFAYLSKYLGKEFKQASHGAKVGRVWGVRGDLELVPPLFFQTKTGRSAVCLARRVRRWAKGKTIVGALIKTQTGRLTREIVTLPGSRQIQKFRHYFRAASVFGHGEGLMDLLRGLDYKQVLPPEGPRRKYNRSTQTYDLLPGFIRPKIPPNFGAIPADCVPKRISAMTAFLRYLNFAELERSIVNV